MASVEDYNGILPNEAKEITGHNNSELDDRGQAAEEPDDRGQAAEEPAQPLTISEALSAAEPVTTADVTAAEISPTYESVSATEQPGTADPLLIAATEFDVTKVEDILNKGHDPNVKGQSGESVVHMMILTFVELDLVQQVNHKAPALEMLGLLVRRGFDINIRCNLKQTPLHVIAKYNEYPEIIKALLASGAKVNVLDKQGHTALHIAVIKRNNTSVKTLVEGGADVNTPNNEGQTPLHLLAKGKRNVPAVQLLLNCGANLNITDAGGRTPLHIAAKWGREEIACELIRDKAGVNMADNSGMTPLHYAVKGDITGKMVLLLLNHGAHCNTQDHISRETALHKAIRLGMVDTIKQLFKFHPSLRIQDLVGDTVIHVAANCKDICVWQLLLSKGGGDIHNIYNRDGMSAVMKAQKAKNQVAIDLIKMFDIIPTVY